MAAVLNSSLKSTQRTRFKASVATCGVLLATFFTAQYVAKHRVAGNPLLAQSAGTTTIAQSDRSVGGDDEVRNALLAVKSQKSTPAANAGANKSAPDYGNLNVAATGDRLIPKKVKTIAIRADGEFAEAPAAPAISEQPPARQLQAAKATPRAADSAASPAQVRENSRVAIATPEPALAVVTPAVVQTSADVTGSVPQTAHRTAAPPANSGFFVQLAASGIEDEARHLAQQLKGQLTGALAGRDLAIIQANVKDKSVYRVRVAELSRDDANALCARIRSAHAACFVTRD